MEDSSSIIGGIVGIVFFIFYIGIIVFFIAAAWKVRTKAGKPGWSVLIPFYSTIVLLEIVNKPTIWFLYMMIPLVGIYFYALTMIELAKSFGKSDGFGIGLLLLPIVFYPMLAFGDAQFQGAGGGKVYDDGILDRG